MGVFTANSVATHLRQQNKSARIMGEFGAEKEAGRDSRRWQEPEPGSSCEYRV
jgi:hypothetical protein